jgi:outer membrane lipoprotein SlyB
MPIARFEMPDGRIGRFEVPEGTTPEQAQELIAQSLKSAPSQPASVKAGAAINDIPRQIGLTARYGIEGLANTAQIVTEPLRYLTDKIIPGESKSVPLGVLATRAADAIGLPSPQGANERVVGDATRLLAGAGGLAKTAQLAAGAVTNPVAQETLRTLSANLPQQFGSAAGAGLAGGASREAGGGAGMQTLAALGGGVAGGMAPGAIQSGVNSARIAFNRLTPQQVDQQISAVLNRAGMDYSQIPERVRQSLRSELENALRAGRELDPQAVRRLADFQLVGATPTRGMVSQNPVQITREMNLAKIGANSADERLQGLPLIQNQNNTTLITRLNEAGANEGDLFRAGERAIGSIQGADATRQQGVNQLYDRVRNMAGGDIPIDRKPFVDNIFGALQRENRMAFLPKELGDTLNSISSGQTPFTPQTVDMLKTMFATASRSASDGNVRAAISIARNALENTPVNLPPVGPGVVTGAQAQMLNGARTQADDILGAMNQARQAAAQRFAWQESARPIEAALGGAQPDKFVQQFVINGTLDDARAISQNAPVQEVKNAILLHLKEKALNGSADEVGKFSQSAFNKALSAIGDRKLALFFTPEELGQLRAVGRVASYMQNQPVGSAVNNSNSGALLLGRGYDALKGLLDKIPGGQTFLTQPLTNIEIAVRNRQAQNIAPGLLAPVERPPLTQGLLLPGLAGAGTAAGLLAAP